MRFGIAPARMAALWVIAVLVLAAQSCDRSDQSTGSPNSPPFEPTMDPVTGAPRDGAVGQTITPVLSWTCSDIDGDPLSFDLFLGTSEPLPLLSSYRIQTCQVSSPLDYATTYYWRVVAHDDHGNHTTSDTWSFTTQSTPLACSVSAVPTEGLPPFDVSFTGYASGGKPPYEYYWIFGDGGASSFQNPVHTYTIPETYSAVLQVTDAEANSCSHNVVILVEGPPNCNATAAPTNGLPPLMVFFNADITGGLPPYGYHWYFGDGAQSTLEDPTHIYADSGIYFAVLEVTDAKSRTCSTTIIITAGPPVACDGSATPIAGPVPLTVTFLAGATGGKDPYTYFWTFGDGGSSTDKNATHTYTREGPFTAVLTVRDSRGSTCTETFNIVVLP